MRRRALFLTVCAGFACAANAFAEMPIVIKFSQVVGNDTPRGKGAERFKDLAEKMTKGRVKVEVYPNGTLYNDKEEIEALQLGAVQMLAPPLAKFGPLGVREFDLFDLPYIFQGKDALYRVTEGQIGRDLLRKLEPKGITGLAYWDNGFKVMSANRPLLVPADFKGLKMQVLASKVLDAQMRALGAAPQVMAPSEVYHALETGVVDGTEDPLSNVALRQMYEVQKDLTVSNHGYLGYAVIVNKKFWEGLPADIRSILETAMKDVTRYTNAIAQQESDQALEHIRKSGKTTIHVITAQEKAEWRRALLPVQKEMEGRVGKDLISAVNKESAALGYK